jgi:hypothetical protein
MRDFKKDDAFEYMRNCFVKVDGLWFVKLEEELGFGKALEYDKKVWEILPKIQARFLKNRMIERRKKAPEETAAGEKKVIEKKSTEQGHDQEDLKLLKDCLDIKMKLDGFLFSSGFTKEKKSTTINGIEIVITKCPWHDTMVKSKREEFSPKIGTVICSAEYSGFAKEFVVNPDFEIRDGICRNCDTCVFRFKKK